MKAETYLKIALAVNIFLAGVVTGIGIVNCSRDPLHKIADEKIADLVNTGYWSHDMSDGRTFFQKLDSANIQRFSGELLGKDYCYMSNVVRAWENSKTHNDILQQKHARGIVLLDTDSKGTCYWVAEFQK